jgi:FAD/FMN-containing dehydrogenase
MFLKAGFPKLVLMVEFTDENEKGINEKIRNLKLEIKKLHLPNRAAQIGADENKYWEIRRDSFNLLREHVRGKKTAPFIDDVIVRPEFLSEFLPKLNDILKDYPELEYTIAGHAASGNFHIIPLVDMSNPKIPQIILDVSDKVYDLVAEYKGSTTAEHNDGIIRTPYLSKIYNSEIIEIFHKVKEIFDPRDIFNPGKKVGGNKKYIREHIVISHN